GLLCAPGIFRDELNCSGRTLGGTQERENIHLGVPEGFYDCGDRAGVIINSDCELLGFSHVGTSCRCAEIIRPDGLHRGRDTVDESHQKWKDCQHVRMRKKKPHPSIAMDGAFFRPALTS